MAPKKTKAKGVKPMVTCLAENTENTDDTLSTAFSMDLRDKVVSLEERVYRTEQQLDVQSIALSSHQMRCSQLEQEVATLRRAVCGQENVNEKLRQSLNSANTLAATQGTLLRQYKGLLDSLLKLANDVTGEVQQIRDRLGMGRLLGSLN